MRFHDPIFANNYENKLSLEGYPGKLLIEVNNLIEGNTVLEIGAGSGFFTIPLLDQGFSVTALDPSKSMLNILSKKIKSHHTSSIINESWENADILIYDTILCVHALYPIKDRFHAVNKMLNHSSNVIIVIRQDSGNKNISGLLRSFFNLHKTNIDYNKELKKIFTAKNKSYKVYPVKENKLLSFSDIEEEAKYYSQHLRIDDTEKVIHALENLVVFNKENKLYQIEAVYQDNIYHIKN